MTRAYNYCQVQPLSKVFSKTSTIEEEHCALFAREGRKWLILVPRGHVLFQIVEEMIREWVFASLFVIIDLKQSGRQRRGRRQFFKYEWLDVFTVSYDVAPQVQLKYVSSVEFKIET